MLELERLSESRGLKLEEIVDELDSSHRVRIIQGTLRGDEIKIVSCIDPPSSRDSSLLGKTIIHGYKNGEAMGAKEVIEITDQYSYPLALRNAEDGIKPTVHHNNGSTLHDVFEQISKAA